MCRAEGRAVAARVVDHVIPHRGDQQLFWDVEGNWQGLCFPHHNRDKQRMECGAVQELDDDGWPLDEASRRPRGSAFRVRR